MTLYLGSNQPNTKGLRFVLSYVVLLVSKQNQIRIKEYKGVPIQHRAGFLGWRGPENLLPVPPKDSGDFGLLRPQPECGGGPGSQLPLCSFSMNKIPLKLNFSLLGFVCKSRIPGPGIRLATSQRFKYKMLLPNLIICIYVCMCVWVCGGGYDHPRGIQNLSVSQVIVSS